MHKDICEIYGYWLVFLLLKKKSLKILELRFQLIKKGTLI